MPTLRTALTRYLHTAPLVDGEVKPASVDLEFAELPGTIIGAFRLMARDLAYDVSELGISTAIGAKEWGVPFTPLPIFVTRRFDYEWMYANEKTGVNEPKDLEGKRVALRSYTVTDALWSRGLLSDVYGVDLDSITWVVTGDEHIGQTKLPPNCELLPGADLAELLESGEVAGILAGYRGNAPQVRPMIADREEAERDWVKAMGAVPVHHTIVVQDEHLAANPGLAADLFDAFTRAKQPLLDRIAAGEDVLGDPAAGESVPHDFGVHRSADLIHPDPMPYGLEANRPGLEAYLRYAYEQHIISRPMAPEELFAPVD
jgi:4,5-dihydroxyphthalate decarboxylase